MNLLILSPGTPGLATSHITSYLDNNKGIYSYKHIKHPIAPTSPGVRRHSSFAGKKLHEVALASLGVDIADSGYGDSVDCAVAVNNVVYRAFGDYAGGDISTYRMWKSIKNNRKFLQVYKPLPGDIILSPTEGKNVGHVGIIGYGKRIYSNNSKTGLFDSHWTRPNWYKNYSAEKRLQVLFYRRIWS